MFVKFQDLTLDGSGQAKVLETRQGLVPGEGKLPYLVIADEFVDQSQVLVTLIVKI
jgi:hypothetical protein